MKRIYTILAAVIIVTANVFAQSPEKMSYQAVIRDASGTLVTTQVGMKLSVLKGDDASSASEEYAETLTPTPNSNGLVSAEFGGQTGWDDIDWTTGKFFIKTETDVDNDGTYDVEGVSQLLSVPYALHAKTAEIITGDINETDPVFDASIASAITKTDTAKWNNKLDTEVDGSITNELQTLSVSNDTIYLSNGGFVKMPVQQEKTYAVGDTALGGVVFYVNANGTHGLVIAKTDQAYDGTSGSLVDYNTAIQLCSDTSRFDEQGKQFFDWRLPTLNEIRILSSHYNNTGENDLLDRLGLPNNSGDEGWYWSDDIFITTDVSGFNDQAQVRRYSSEINTNGMEEDCEGIEYMMNVRCVRSF
ncbi:MAG: hypothetical protein JEZ09_20185 [Salinivirgaceae bacterium]|nr:hypothetical protein [Salinivirgaceae bacterium]